MFKKRLVSFGDSWAEGSELLPGEKSFGELLSDRLGCEEFSNRGIPASSINHLTVELKSHLHVLSYRNLDPSEWMAVFFLTDQNRGMTAHNGQHLFQNAMGGFGCGVERLVVDAVNDAYWKYIHSPELSDITTNTTIMSLQSMCRYHGIKDYYIAGWQTFNFWDEVDTSRIYHSGKISCGNLIGAASPEPHGHNIKNPNQAPGGHPNQQGHQIIADALYTWITDYAG